jgi:hypothetical protein
MDRARNKLELFFFWAEPFVWFGFGLMLGYLLWSYSTGIIDKGRALQLSGAYVNGNRRDSL